MNNITLPVITFNNVFDSDDWVMYSLHDSSGTIQFVGCCSCASIIETPDARRSGMFDKVFPPGSQMTVRVMFKSPSKRDCQNKVWEYMRSNPRPLMMKQFVQATRTYVHCNETGRTYNSQREACEAEGVTQSQLSNHLRGWRGCNTVRGKTFRNVTEGDFSKND